MRIPGVVDVYQVGAEWVARSWPKVQNQPNSAAQLFWRKKFKDAHALIKTWTGAYMAAWQAIPCPKGKMWIDIAMTSLMHDPWYGDLYYDAWTSTAYLRHQTKSVWGLPEGYYLGGEWPEATVIPGWSQGWIRHPSDNRPCVKWDNHGFICPNGKRPKIKWVPSPTGKNITCLGSWHIGYYGRDWYFYKYEDCPEGLNFVPLFKSYDTVEDKTDWWFPGGCVKYKPIDFSTEVWL